MDTRARHMTMDIWLNTELSDSDVERVRKVVREKMTVMREVEHQFTPHGLTVVFVLAESHFSIHTYPENRYLSIDCYVCNPSIDLDGISAEILDGLEVKHCELNILDRGVMLAKKAYATG